jgi:hypothetical protein
MTRLIRSEALKVTSIRAPWLLTAAVAALAALGAGLVLFTDNPMRADVLNDLAAQRTLLSLAPAGVFALIIGALVSTGDHRHGTATPTYVLTPDRLQPLLARGIVTVGAVVTLAAAVAAAISAVAIPSIIARGELLVGVGDIAAVWGRDVLLLVTWGVIGFGVGEAVRSQIAAVVGSLVFVLVVAPVVSSILPAVSWYLPSGLENIIISTPAEAPFGIGIAALLLGAYAAAALSTGAAVLTRRDIG